MTIMFDSITTGPISAPARILLLGREKVGKSTFASEADSPVFICPAGEDGLDAIDAARFPTAQSFEDVLNALRALHREAHDYKTVVVDSASALEPLLWQHACRENGWSSIESPGYGKGYVEALSYWRQMCTALDYLRRDRGMTSIIIGHTKVKVINDPLTDPFDGYVFDINDRAANLVYRWVDSILFATFRTFTKKATGAFGKTTTHAVSTGEPVLLTRARPNHPGGGRGAYGRLPYELPLSWARFQDAVATVENKTQEKTNGQSE